MSDIEPWLAENYEGLVADPVRVDTFDSIAERAEKSGDKSLAAWARKRAAATADVTPRKATPAPKSTRGE